MDHLSAQERQHVADQRSGPEGRHIQYPQAPEREPGWPVGHSGRAVGPARQGSSYGVLAQPRGRFGRA